MRFEPCGFHWCPDSASVCVRILPFLFTWKRQITFGTFFPDFRNFGDKVVAWMVVIFMVTCGIFVGETGVIEIEMSDGVRILVIFWLVCNF